MKPFRIALVFESFGRGGVPGVMLALAREFLARGFPVDLAVIHDGGPRRPDVPEGARIFSLESMQSRYSIWRLTRKRYRLLGGIAPLARYFDEQCPDIVLSAGNYLDFVILRARARARIKPKLVVSQHSTFSRDAMTKPFVRWTKRRVCACRTVDAFVAVSGGVADDLAAHTRLARERVTTIYNPAVTPEIIARSRQAAPHPWLEDGDKPVFVGAARLFVSKDFPTLIRAFATVHAKRSARLIILGEGRERTRLESLVEELGVANDVDLPGYVTNPYAYMSRAAALVVPSTREGFSNVVAEALACGCPVVSTDCRNGPAEILENGRYGRLVPVGDWEAMAAAMEAVLDSPGDREAGRRRAAEFSGSAAADRYLELFGDLLEQSGQPARPVHPPRADRSLSPVTLGKPGE